MAPGSPYLEEVRKLRAGAHSCLSQALQLALSLIRPGELTALTLHSDGYADDPDPGSEARAVEDLCGRLRGMDVFVNAIAYSPNADFRLLARLANAASGSCVRADNPRELYDALAATSRALAAATAATVEEPLGVGYDYQVFLSRSACRVVGSAGALHVPGLRPGDDAVVYKYRKVPRKEYGAARGYAVAQTSEPVFAFARAQLAEGNLNTAKYALASTFDATLTERHARALTNPEVAELAHDLDAVLFHPAALDKHDLRKGVAVNERISVLELTRLLQDHAGNLIVNRRHLQENYTRRGLKRVAGERDEAGNLVEPWLKAEPLGGGEYARVGTFEISHNTATITMLLVQRVRLVSAADAAPVTEVAGVLVDDLSTYQSYALVSDGEVNVKALRVKIGSRQTFDALKAAGVLERQGRPAREYDFRAEYDIRLEGLPLVPLGGTYPDLDGVFQELAGIKVLSSLLSACLKEESPVYSAAQLEELRKHYLSRNLYVNFPTTTEHADLQEALAAGAVDTRVSYRVEIGSWDILNLDKLPPANQFLQRMYEVQDARTRRKLARKPTADLALDDSVRLVPKELSPRARVTRADEFMRRIVDDFLGLHDNGSVDAILARVGAEALRRLLRERWEDAEVGREELIEAMAAARGKLEAYAERLYREKVAPLVFYIGSTGLLPDEMAAKAQTAEELEEKYPHLQFSRQEREGTFFEVGDTVIGVYPRREYFSV
jgi:hypothetical protein